ncbi:MAG: DivIVA domain-containing protein [Thermoanaerobaculia bacterium]|nr:DivIVA domain-containing protein [Thermoanaerobaculia bacterium]MCZ7652379.1 DivIVA domain-containing protein [Thermoanaerobaculia bacterium]
MSLTPLEIQKAQFAERRRGYDPEEVHHFLSLVAETLTARLAQIERLEGETRFYAERLRDAEERERQLQETLVRGQRVSEEIVANSHREAQLLIKEAEHAADKIVEQALEQAQHVESRIQELRLQRKEMQMRLRNVLDLYRQMLESDEEEERATATVRTLPRAARRPA